MHMTRCHWRLSLSCEQPDSSWNPALMLYDFLRFPLAVLHPSSDSSGASLILRFEPAFELEAAPSSPSLLQTHPIRPTLVQAKKAYKRSYPVRVSGLQSCRIMERGSETEHEGENAEREAGRGRGGLFRGVAYLPPPGVSSMLRWRGGGRSRLPVPCTTTLSTDPT